MKVTNFFMMLLSCTLLLGVISCGDDDDDAPPVPENCNNPENALQDELNAFMAAGEAYGEDPTPQNCTAYKNAYQAYIDAIKPYINCPGLTQAEKDEFNDEIEAAEAEIETLCD